MNITTIEQFNKALEAGPWAWPGGYPVYFICADGEALSFVAAQENAELVREAIQAGACYMNDWRVVAIDINWEHPDLYCCHTGNRIPSAYAEPEET